ncbi:nitroreductase family protein [Halopseudomonas salegens]|uniref:Putative NAD(P)H nitroreductase n=1 Tax=Halopseudomonas salegens TaxID=1434072 RepID=A0A1H2G6T9_9GAMM|nr:nitroreductase [Halopseudomonas salegens]SDU15211.1 Nitroreductase [Halopseudomonas salegens]
MDALHALHGRVSVPRLTGPAPSPEQREQLFKAALRAPDHAWLRPWRFLVLEQPGLEQLGELFVQAALHDEPELSTERQDKLRRQPLRAPMIIVAISCRQSHPKVPASEQDLACGAAVSNMLVAAHALDLGAVWRTGEMAYHPVVRKGLGLADNEQVIAFLYLGQCLGQRKAPPELATTDFFTPWSGPAAG